jgi:hypothetical protein
VQLVTQTIRWHCHSAPSTPVATAVGCATTAVVTQAPAANMAAAKASANRLRRDDEDVMTLLLEKPHLLDVEPGSHLPCESVHNRPTTIA